MQEVSGSIPLGSTIHFDRTAIEMNDKPTRATAP